MGFNLPVVNHCCLCVTDLKSAAAIIAVLGIVTSPIASWAVVKHSYVIRVSCYVSTSKTRRDILDINFNNVLSFGVGANAGLEPSCLGQPIADGLSLFTALGDSDNYPATFFYVVQIYGWLVLLVDLGFLFVSILFLIKIFHGSVKKIALIFMCTAIVATIISFIYGMMFVSACIAVGGSFPIFEFAFCCIDVMVWAYFLIVVNSYRNGSTG